MTNHEQHISDHMLADADARVEYEAQLDREEDAAEAAEDAREEPCLDADGTPVYDGPKDQWRDYDAEDVEIDFDDDDGFDLTDDFDPSGGLTEADFPVEENDGYTCEDGWREADAEAYHSQWD
jgi:hypothetical protein